MKILVSACLLGEDVRYDGNNSSIAFNPKVSFEEGLKKFAEWVNTQEVQEDKYQKSIEEMKAKGLYK